jgi:hypothetical protein
MKSTLLLFFLTISLMATTEHNKSDTNSTKKKMSASEVFSGVEFEMELDAYYSNISWTFSLTNGPVPNAKDKTEWEMYYDLIRDSLPPRFIVLELSVNPLPLLGTYLKAEEQDFHQSSVIFEDVNLVDAITAGFEVPYALSMFIGNTVKFTHEDDKKAGSNRAYSGILLSTSDKHIKDNVLVDDNSFELEVKVLGSRALEDYKLKWSYRIGMRLHDNQEITDSVYVGFRRSRLDFETDALSVLNNSAIQYTTMLSRSGFDVIGHEFYFEKKFPVTWFGKKMGVNFGLGYIYQGDGKYSGTLKQKGIETDRLIIRPNIEF